MARKKYWNGFATGAAVGVGASLVTMLGAKLAGSRGARVIRLEKTVQIGRPVEQVFQSWSDLEKLARSSSLIQSITDMGKRSHWVLHIEGKQVEWDAEIEQFIPNQAIGWKSVNGPKHTGRITFSPIQNDTIVTVTMNYAPPTRVVRLAPVRERIEQHMEQVIRDFKASLEGKGQEGALGTGTTGAV